MVNVVTSKSINTLVADINALLRDDKKFSKGGLEELNSSLSTTFVNRLGENDETPKDILRMSNFGTKCDRKLWYTVNRPDHKEELLPHTRLKFLYGDIIEAVILSLAKEAGHEVTGQQDRLELEGVVGHRDAIIDGVLIDVKSANARSFQKFRAVEFHDSFGYIDQLNLYLEASQKDPLLKIKRIGGFLVVDKELGHIHLRLEKKSDENWTDKIKKRKAMVALAEAPQRLYKDVAEGMSGNRKLGMECGYCQFKKLCWPGLRTFLYSSGPVFLTEVKKEPNVLEIT
jgi:hypothetical protein